MNGSDGGSQIGGEQENTIEASFALLELCLEQLASLAPVSSTDEILGLIPNVSEAAQRLILVELIKFDLATAADHGMPRSLDFYWPDVGDLLPQEAIPFDLVLEEVQLRRAAGDNPKWADYRLRFPDLADTIGKWLAGGDTNAFSGATSKVPELPVGAQFDDFQVLTQLGQGAFARVYLARQVSMHRLVALKATSRGSEEPQALSQLDHTNVVRVYDQREVKEPLTILLYMQYVAGGTLADCIKQVRELPPELWSGEKILESIDNNLLDASQTVPEQSSIRKQIASMQWAEVVAWFGIQLAEGLNYANQKGILHRDVKPANILLSAEAIPKLADFNVSCSGLSGRAGAAAYFGGSLAYMSPEQLQVADPTVGKPADELDGRSDLYALGIVLWELWQGQRPWALNELASSWTDAVRMQREIRLRDLEPSRKALNAAERVLEKVLRSQLHVDPDDRPATGKETAARLRLAFYPELANRFEPDPQSFAGRLLSIPVLLISAILVFGPNIAASVFNYKYNEQRMVADHMPADQGPAEDEEADATQLEPVPSADSLPPAAQTLPESTLAEQAADDSELAEELHPVVAYFKDVSFAVNLIVFPLGAFLFWIVIRPLMRIMKQAKMSRPANSEAIDYLWTIGYRATLITAVLWAVSGAVFAAAMLYRFPDSFRSEDAFHFFLSLVLCGGVAWIYPYYGMTLLSLLVYYPRVIAPTMSDPEFESRSSRIRRHSSWYLLSAAAIPLTAIGALVFRDQLHEWLVLGGVVITALGLAVAYSAHQKIELALAQYAKVLGDQDRGMTV